MFIDRPHRPLLVATSAAVTTATATFTLNRPLANVGFGRDFLLRLDLALIPTGSTAVVQLTDASGAIVPVRNWRGDLLRADSLRHWAERNPPDRPLDAYLNDDDLHVAVFNRMRPTAFVVTPPPAA